MSNELAPVEQRAALALESSKTEQDLRALVDQLKTVTVVNSPAGRDQAHALAMTATRARTAIEKAGKAARDDATKFSKAVIAEEARLIALVEPEEKRVKGLRDAWDKAEAERKEAEAQRERDRIAAHQAAIEQIKGYPALAAQARTSTMALQMLERLTAIDVSGLEEFAEAAAAAKLDADEKINDIIDAKKADEAAAEQRRLDGLRNADIAALDKIVSSCAGADLERVEQGLADAEQHTPHADLGGDRLAAVTAHQADACDRLRQMVMAAQVAKAQADELAAARALIARQQAALEAQRKPAATFEPTAWAREFDEALNRPAATFEPTATLIQNGEREEVTDDVVDAEVSGAELVADPVATDDAHMVIVKGEALPAASVSHIERPTDEELIDVIAKHYDVSPSTAHGWLADYDANAVIHRLAQAA